MEYSRFLGLTEGAVALVISPKEDDDCRATTLVTALPRALSHTTEFGESTAKPLARLKRTRRSQATSHTPQVASLIQPVPDLGGPERVGEPCQFVPSRWEIRKWTNPRGGRSFTEGTVSRFTLIGIWGESRPRRRATAVGWGG